MQFCRSYSYYTACFCPKMASDAISEHLISKYFLGEHALRPPYSLACLCIPQHAHIHVTPLLKILATDLVIAERTKPCS